MSALEQESQKKMNICVCVCVSVNLSDGLFMGISYRHQSLQEIILTALAS